MKKLFGILTVFLGTLLLVSSVPACSCIDARDVYDTPQKLYDITPTVALVKLVSLQKQTDNDPYYKIDGYVTFKMIVEKAYKGDIKDGEELTFEQGGGADCIWAFRQPNIGSEFLVYLGSKPAKDELWEIPTCSGSISLAEAKTDITFLDKNIAKKKRAKRSRH